MEKQDMLENYIANNDHTARQDEELAELCDLADEIRALNPPLPSADFTRQITQKINQEITQRQKKSRRWGWLGGGISVAAAVTIVMAWSLWPHKSDMPAPVLPQQQIAQVPDNNTTTTENTQKEMQIASNISTADTRTLPEPKKVPLRETGADVNMKQANVSYSQQIRQDTNNVETGQSRLRAAKIAAEETQTDIHGKLPFKVLTIPERSPARIKVEENPPAITLVYLAGKNEIVVRQWEQDPAITANTLLEQSQALRVVRGNTIVEVSGNVERAMLEEFANTLQ